MKYIGWLFLVVTCVNLCVGQSANPTNKTLAESQVMQLRTGTLVVRLKTNDRSIKAYRDAGKNKIADKLENENREMNLYLMRAFLKEFDFCPVVFIKASDSKRLINREANIFLNAKLEIDSTIPAIKGYFLIGEYGTVMANERVDENKYDLSHTKPSATPTSTSALFISDTTFSQLKEPFPFYSVLGLIGTKTLNENSGGPASIELKPDQILENKKKAKENAEKTNTLYDKAVKKLNDKILSYCVKVVSKSGKDQAGLEMVAQDENSKKKTLQIIQDELIKLYAEREKFKR